MAETQVGEISDQGKMSIRAMTVLTLPTLAFSAASTLVPVFVPQLLKLVQPDISNTLVGFIIGGEGIFCLLIPLWVGIQSDRIWTERWGRRRPFMIYAAPFMAAALMLLPFQASIVAIAVSTFVFFAAYQLYSSPYQSLLPDVTAPAYHGRVQGYQSVMRGGGMFLGMLAAPSLFGVSPSLPFLICGALMLVFTYITVSKVDEPQPLAATVRDDRSVWREVGRLTRMTWANVPIRRFMAAAFLWEGTLAAIKPFIISYFTDTLGASFNMSTGILIEVGAVYLVAGLVGGYLADRFGRFLIMRIGIVIYFLGSIIAMLLTNYVVAFAVLPLFGLGGAIVMTLPYAILMKLMPRDQIGGFTAMFSMVRGAAVIFAPMVAGAAIDLVKNYLVDTEYLGREYAAIWVVCAVMLIASLFLLKGISKGEIVETPVEQA